MTARDDARAALANIEQARDIHLGRFDGAVAWDAHGALTAALERAENAARALLDESVPADEFKFTDAQWREYQAIPDQGYSHRHWIEHQVNEWFRRQSSVPAEPFCADCSGPYLTKDSESNRWLEEQYGGHWDTCPNRVESVPADEREALAELIEGVGLGLYLPGSHGHDYINPGKAADAIIAAGFRRQGPITDAQVEAAWSVLELETVGHYTRANMRAALEAARDAS